MHTRLLKLDFDKVSWYLKLTVQHNASFIVDVLKYFNVDGKDGVSAQWIYRYTNAVRNHHGVPTLLHEVCRIHHHKENDAIQLLVKPGLDANCMDENGETPFHVLSMVPKTQQRYTGME